MIGIRYSLDTIALGAGVDRTAGRMARLGPFLNDVGLLLVRSVARNFKAGGRPLRWKASMRARRDGGQTLVRTARLKNSITFSVAGNTLTLGSRVKYAAIHQTGGTIDRNVTVKKHWRIMTRAFGRPVPARKVAVRRHERHMHLTLPARPFLVVQDADWRIVKRMYADHAGAS